MLKDYITLLVKPTHECNLNCTYCYDNVEKNKVNNKIITDEIIFKISELADNTYKKINWTWHGGEPLIISDENYARWYDIIKNKENKIFMMQSNGDLLNKERKEFLKKHDVNYSISYDFINNNENRNLSKSIFQIDPYSELSCINVIDYDSSFKLIETYERFKNLKRNVSFNKIFLDEKFEENVEQYTENWKNYFIHYIRDKDCVKEDRVFNSYFDSIFSIHGESVMCSEKKCIGSFLSVNPDGDIFPCDRFGKMNASKYCFGNVENYEFSFKEYKMSEGYRNLVEDVLKAEEQCRGCEVYSFCKGGCKANRVNENGEIDLSILSKHECYYLKTIYSTIFTEMFNLEKEELLDINPFVYEKIFKNKLMLKFSIKELEEKTYE